MTITNISIIITTFVTEWLLITVITSLLVIIPMMFIKNDIR
jgi:hypothetical protein